MNRSACLLLTPVVALLALAVPSLAFAERSPAEVLEEARSAFVAAQKEDAEVFLHADRLASSIEFRTESIAIARTTLEQVQAGTFKQPHSRRFRADRDALPSSSVIDMPRTRRASRQMPNLIRVVRRFAIEEVEARPVRRAGRGHV